MSVCESLCARVDHIKNHLYGRRPCSGGSMQTLAMRVAFSPVAVQNWTNGLFAMKDFAMDRRTISFTATAAADVPFWSLVMVVVWCILPNASSCLPNGFEDRSMF